MYVLRILLLTLFLGLTTGAALPTTIPLIETEDLDGTFHWKRIPVLTADTTEGSPRTAFEHFFRYGCYGVPENVKVLDVSLLEGLLTVNVSKDILSYGGSAFERALVEQLTKIAAEIPGTERFTLTIDGVLRPLIQGTEIDRLQLRTCV